ncbi:helix-turn-helix domain-containing protein [Pirellulales bacterium]|nr:helix-turn-helix domain-containing protein [Pirellulales bacterium]
MSKSRSGQGESTVEAPQVAVLVDTSTGWGRRLIGGVQKYAAKHGPWHLWVEPRGRSEAMRLPTGWNGDGVIARVSTPRLADQLQACRQPVINISSISLDGCQLPRVTTNYASVAKLAFEYFCDRGYRQFAYLGPLKDDHVRRHAAEFRKETRRVSGDFFLFDHLHESMTRRNWLKRRRDLHDWIAGLPKPIGIFSWATTAGAQLLDVCRYGRIVVPDDVAVLAGDDDDLMCNTTVPPMSAVITASEQIGYQAANRLDRLMAGHPDFNEDELIDPLAVASRQSTEALAIDDLDLLRAVRYLRQHATGVVRVSEVAASVPMTRRSLERRFHDVLGRSPLEEIQRLKLERCRELLVTTGMSIANIATASGFGTPEYMTTLFRKRFNTTPLRYRSQTRTR